MYAGYGFRTFEIGDVDVLWHDGLFHLFHLVLPNHDYIAHAVSEDGLTWRRVQNALFISDPGAWDDDMLWTMHVSPDPHREGGWRMFYTGLSMREQGRVQRIGLARSQDLYTWEKETGGGYPLESPGYPYEHSLEEGRHWVSFRDPFYHREDGRGVLLAAARVGRGSVIRRGCVALLEETGPDEWSCREPLFHPGRYDDVEVPSVLKLGGRYYLLGSIREDVKVHYWYADRLEGPYRNFSDNVLLPQGNYAARICHDEANDRFLIWNFFFKGSSIRGEHLLPPPKELDVTEGGELRLRSYRDFDTRVKGCVEGAALAPLIPLFDNLHAGAEKEDGRWRLGSDSGFEVFLLQGEHVDYRLTGTLRVEERGKFGLVMHLQGEGSGYYLSLDLVKGLAQIRCWGDNPDGGIEEAFHYQQLQAAFFVAAEGPHRFSLISYGTYLELSLDGFVLLSLSDEHYRRGRVGFYVESARIAIGDLVLETLECPANEPYVAQDPAAERS